MMEAFLIATAVLAGVVGSLVVVLADFEPAMRLLVAGVYFLIATTAASAAALLWHLEERT